MTTYGVVQGWGTPINVPVRVMHLTRRGRILRSVLLLAVVLVVTLSAVGRLTSQPALAEEAAPSGPMSTLGVTVAEGDSLWAIARATAPEHDPREVVLEIRELNGLSSNTIQPGQVLLVPSMP